MDQGDCLYHVEDRGEVRVKRRMRTFFCGFFTSNDVSDKHRMHGVFNETEVLVEEHV